MKPNHLWMIFLVMQALSVFQTQGQEPGNDSTFFQNSTEDTRNWQLPSAQPSMLFSGSELGNRVETLYGTSMVREMTDFHLNPRQHRLSSPYRDSIALFVPRYPGVGDYQNFGGTLGRLKLTENLAVDYGAFISAQYGFLLSSKQIVFGSNYLLRYSLTNKLHFQSWGQYVSPGNSNDPTFDLPDFFPKSHFGAGLLYDANEKAQINMGVEYQYDQLNKIWKPESGGKVRIKF